MKQKIKDLKIETNIHTIAIVTNEQFPQGVKGISHIKLMINEKSGEVRYLTKINVREYYNEKVHSLRDYLLKLNTILDKHDIENFDFTRVDFNFDCCEDNYNQMQKLNKLMILLLSLNLNIKNRYQSFEPLTLENLTVRIQSEYFEAENYNKNIESNGLDEAKNRLELRSKALLKRNKRIHDLLFEWCNKLKTATLYYPDLQKVANQYLISKWNIEMGKDVKSASEFIRKYQQNFYTTKQLIEFYKLIGVENPSSSAYNFNSKNKLEFFNISDLKNYVKVLNKSAEKFLAFSNKNK